MINAVLLARHTRMEQKVNNSARNGDKENF